MVPAACENRSGVSGAQSWHCQWNGLPFNSDAAAPQRGHLTPFGQRRATRYALQASSSGKALSNWAMVIWWRALGHFKADMAFLKSKNRQLFHFALVRPDEAADV